MKRPLVAVLFGALAAAAGGAVIAPARAGAHQSWTAAPTVPDRTVKVDGLDITHREASEPGPLGALTFVQAVINTRGAVSDADAASAHRAGLSDAERAEDVGEVAYYIFISMFNRALDVEVNVPRVEAHNHAAEHQDPRVPALGSEVAHLTSLLTRRKLNARTEPDQTAVHA